jgi:hypothetical protein
MHLPEPAVLEAMKTLVRKCAGGQVIYRAKRGDAWLCDVQHMKVTESAFAVDLKPLRRHECGFPPQISASVCML